MNRPIIGISSNFQPHKGEQGLYSVDRSYVDAVYATGGLAQVIPILPNDEIPQLIAMYDGILLSGGGGLLPHVKKMSSLPNLEKQSPHRYTFEYALIQEAFHKNIPLLGVCRGHQMINAVKGGTIKNLPSDDHNQTEPTDVPSHSIDVKSHSKLLSYVKKTSLSVNSIHNQVIDQVGTGLTINALSSEGYIEGIESENDHFVLGVQFHPELMIQQKEMFLIYKKFIQAAIKYRQTKD